MFTENINSWVLSLKNSTNTQYNHHYFCSCTKEFKLQTEIDDLHAPDILCPICGNDYFKDAAVFENMKSTKIWKYFGWTSVVSEDDAYWRVSLAYKVPRYNEVKYSVEIKDEILLDVAFRKDGYFKPKSNNISQIVHKYSLFLDDKVQTFKKVLLQDANLHLYKFILSKKSEYKNILESRVDEKHSADEKIQCVKEVQMLSFALKLRQERSITKALYLGYEDAINSIGFYPYSDYIFSSSIKNIDLLIQLYGINPKVKQYIFTDETFEVAVEFIEFLKLHYTEKQIVKLFVEDMKDVGEHAYIRNYWRDTLRMTQTPTAYNSLEENFTKVKPTIRKLHDELVRVFHIASYKLSSKESFEYSKVYLAACVTYEGLEFKLPLTVKELSLWANTLHNCMFGYSTMIHKKRIVIYGVFRNGEILYALELKGFKIVQAKAVANSRIYEEDMLIINAWKEKNLNKI